MRVNGEQIVRRRRIPPRLNAGRSGGSCMTRVGTGGATGFVVRVRAFGTADSALLERRALGRFVREGEPVRAE
ncbi:hypothetical protein GCM10009550_60300 [Actinocorallia libanotica]|uniref:Uncharacterized protein n=1 Tax=Actinocorallia libanotica TaxID=46162 RepID=A0ABP4CDF7_9ACTN